MNRLHIYIASACTLAASVCYAEPAQMAGPYAGVTVGWSDANLRLRDNGFTMDGFGLSGPSVGVIAGYLAPVTEGAAVFGLEVSAAWEGADGSIREAGFRQDLELRYSVSVSALGGIPVGSALAYVKAGFGWAEGKVSISEPGFSASGTETFSGPGVGVGIALPLSDTTALRAAYSRHFYSEEDGLKPEQGKFDVGVAWLF